MAEATVRRTFAFLLSLLTLFGGHVLNRRWDRAVLFAALSAAWLSAAWFGGGWWLASQVVGQADPYAAMGLFLRVLQAGVLALFILSAVIAALDAGRAGVVQERSVSGMIGGFGLSALGLAAAAAGVLSHPIAPFPDSRTDAEAHIEELARETFNFTHLAAYGGELAWDGGPPARGDARIVGRLMHDGEPAVGVRLAAFLNGQFRVENLVTDAAGRFHVSVAPGAWQVNGVQTQAWKNKPEGEFVVLTGSEPDLHIPYRSRSRARDGLKVQAATEIADEHFTILLRDAVELEWPPHADEELLADSAVDRIRWRAPKTASQHLVTISRIQRTANGYRSESVFVQQVEGASSLPLAELPIARDEGANEEYGVKVDSFDSDGKLISRSYAFMEDRSFRLQDQRIVGGSGALRTPASAPRPMAGIKANLRAQDQLYAARILIEEALYEPAATLLARIDPQHVAPGQLSLQRGRLLAKQGQCEVAEVWFAQALRENPALCVTGCRGDCPSPAE